MAQHLSNCRQISDETELKSITRENQISRWILMLLFFLAGWLGATITKAMPDGLLNAATLAWQNQYQATAGNPGDPRVYYLISGEMDLVFEQLENDTDVSKLERTPIERVAMVTIDRNFTSAFNRIRKLEQVETMMTIPLFCH
ncbi:MAG: hypothetical protein ACR2QW_06070 [bacterium]